MVDRLLIRLTVLQCLWSVVALRKAAWGSCTFTVSQQLLSALTSRQSSPHFQLWDVTTAFLPWHCLIRRPKLLGTKQGSSLRTATNWSFGLFTLTLWNLEYNFVNPIQEGAVPSFFSQSYFNSEGLTSKKNSKNYFKSKDYSERT